MQRRMFQDFLRAVFRWELIPHRLRPLILRKAGVTVGNQCLFMSGIRISRSAPIRIGSNVFVNYDSYFDAQAEINVGSDCRIADNVRIVTSTHNLGTEERRAADVKGLPITIGSGTWIGSGATILPGVTIGRGCVVAAGSVVTKECKPNNLYAGVPAKWIKSLP
ncbi:acyltransferase [Kocuria oceani]|uniref:Acyltransferase n=1 Tax=Kocuria oceani TaxID=988827 RepID=A0ABV9TE71_9MICC|nr:acyltransferase [Kocuria oceani]